MNDLVERLLKRAEIRRSIPRGEPDRIADLLEEAARAIVELTADRDSWEQQNADRCKDIEHLLEELSRIKAV